MPGAFFECAPRLSVFRQARQLSAELRRVTTKALKLKRSNGTMKQLLGREHAKRKALQAKSSATSPPRPPPQPLQRATVSVGHASRWAHPRAPERLVQQAR
jgi:hypothetical protein